MVREMQGGVISGEKKSHSVMSTLTVFPTLWQARHGLNPFNTQAALRGRLFYLYFTEDLTTSKSGYGIWAQNLDSFYSETSAINPFTTCSPASGFCGQFDDVKVIDLTSLLRMIARVTYSQTRRAICDISNWDRGTRCLPFYEQGTRVIPLGKCRIKSRNQTSSLLILCSLWYTRLPLAVLEMIHASTRTYPDSRTVVPWQRPWNLFISWCHSGIIITHRPWSAEHNKILYNLHYTRIWDVPGFQNSPYFI